MLHFIATYAHFPSNYTVLGMLFAIYGILVILYDIKCGYLNGITRNFVYQIFHYKLRSAFLFALIFFSVLWLDVPVTKLCQKLYVVDVYTIFDFWCSIGESWFMVGVLIFLSLIFQLFNKLNHTVVCKISYISAIYAGLFNSIIKLIFNRQRPSIGLSPYHFFYFFQSHDSHWIDLSYAYDSMPSGHTITMFAAIFPIFLYLSKWWQKILLLILAAIVGIARIYTINHWLSDVLTGTIFGILIGMSCYIANSHRFKRV